MSTKTWLRCTALAVISSVATGWTVHSCSDPDLVETPGEKVEWSVLQAVEYRERGTVLAEPVVRTVGEHEVLGVRGASGQNVWVLLKPKAPPFYKQMPAGNYELAGSMVEQLQRERRVSYTVLHALRSHARKE